MFERSELALKIVCGAVLTLVLYRLGLAVVHIFPLYHVTIPPLPTLTADASAAGTKSGSNSVTAPLKAGTNTSSQVAGSASTNAPGRSTNAVVRVSNVVHSATSTLASSTNASSTASNSVALNAASRAHLTNNLVTPTNSVAAVAERKAGPGSNDLAQTGVPPGRRSRSAGPGLPGMPGGAPGMAQPGPPLPPEIQARIDRVIDSEILAPVMRPQPMALLGIAGKDVFLRAPNGQTGLVKEGDELGGVKLVRIGINRVLVEEQGEQKELTIFAGIGSESLLSAKKDSPK
jgi:hypothetical protein